MSFLFGRPAPAKQQPQDSNGTKVNHHNLPQTTANNAVASSSSSISNQENTNKTKSTSLTSANEIGSYQPFNEFKDLIILPYFSNQIKHLCPLDDERRFITGDVEGNLLVWDAENGSLLKKLDNLHRSAINGLVKLRLSHQFTNKFNYFDRTTTLDETSTNADSTINTASQSNLIIVSSIDKTLSIWDTDSYTLIKSIRYDEHQTISLTSMMLNSRNHHHHHHHHSSSMKVFLNYENRFFICAGTNLHIYEVNLMNMMNLVDEFQRDNHENTIRYLIQIKDDKLAAATNSDIEIYGLVRFEETVNNKDAAVEATLSFVGSAVEQSSSLTGSRSNMDYELNDQSSSSSSTVIKLKELKKFSNAHRETITCLERISDIMFGSASSDGTLLLIHSETLLILFELKPFDELNHNQSMLKMNPTSISSFTCLFNVNNLFDLNLNFIIQSNN
jgi:WD40 repeat protein